MLHRPKIIVLGPMCRRPIAGVVWQVLHYLLGFEQLGFESYYVESHGNWIPDPCEPSPQPPRIVIDRLMRELGFADRWLCRADQVESGHTFGGLDRSKLASLYGEAAAIINVTGSHVLDEDQLQCPRRVYLETDPGIPQILLARGDAQMKTLVDAHTHHFTFGENIHSDTCRLPPVGIPYKTTRQPIVMERWEPPRSNPSGTFSTIARWQKAEKNKDVDFKNETYYWNKDIAFSPYLELPRRSGQELELALANVPEDDRRRLERNGWRVVDALPLSASISAYRDYIHGSRGEFTIAKDQYVRLRTGWFSDRSACYLAAGKPVVTQDTGFGSYVPTGDGLFAFQTVDDILAAFDALDADYERHSKAARAIARDFFDARVVLRKLLTDIGLGANA